MPTDDLLRAALTARDHAHAPYSGFKVGAALRASDGTIHAGCNVENAAFPQGQCAEATAIGVMVAAGAVRIAEILVVADGPETVSPCGGCRQRLVEFADPATPVHLAGPEGVRATVTLGELLPRAFGWRQVSKESP
jgi:cytidine deaminase